MLVARFEKLPERRRPYFTPEQRFRFLEIQSLLGWSAARMARVAVVCVSTLYNWHRQADHAAETVGTLVAPTPPVRRAADVVRHIAQRLVALGMGGGDHIASVLARAGWRLSARSVRRYVKERPILTPPSRGLDALRKSRPVIARFTHHTWMMDVTEVKQFLGRTLYVAAVFDAFARQPLLVRTFDEKPTAPMMAALLREAVRTFQAPKYVITDLGGEFTGTAFRNAVRGLGSLLRYASADSIRATARLERFWRTLKELGKLRGIRAPIDRRELERRLAIVLEYYAAVRPHEGLDARTPVEAFLGIAKAANDDVVEAPRGRPGEDVGPPPFRVEHLDPDGLALPYLTRIA